MFVALLNYAIHFEIKITITDCFLCVLYEPLSFLYGVFLYELPKLRRTERKKLSSIDARSTKLFLQV